MRCYAYWGRWAKTPRFLHERNQKLTHLVCRGPKFIKNLNAEEGKTQEQILFLPPVGNVQFPARSKQLAHFR